MTQCYRLDADESSDEEIVHPIKRRNTTAAVQGRVTVHAIKREVGAPLLIGDLVMSTTQKINYPAYDEERISPSYLFIGCVKGYRRRKVPGNGTTCDMEHVYVNLMNVEVEGYR